MRLQLVDRRFLLLIPMICLSPTSLCFERQDQLGDEQASRPTILTQYDKATKTTRLLLTSIPLPKLETDDFNLLYINAAMDYPGRKPKIPEAVKLGFGSRPCHMANGSGPEVTIWVDSRLIYFGRLQGLFCAGGIGRESEFGVVEVPYADFVEIAEAREVHFHVGRHQFRLGDDAQREFRKLLSSVTGSPEKIGLTLERKLQAVLRAGAAIS
jgi:hypothetical protein